MCRVVWSSIARHICWNIPLDPRRHASTWNILSLWPRLFSPRAFIIHSIAQLTWHPTLCLSGKSKNRMPPPATLCLRLTLRIRLKSSLSTLKKWQLSSRKTIEAALGASFTSANLPKSSPSCRVQTTPWREQNIQMETVPETEHAPTRLIPLCPWTLCIQMGYTQGCLTGVI